MHACVPLPMDEQGQGDQLEPTYSSYVSIRDVALNNCRKKWTMERGGERGSGIFVLMTWHDNDDDDKLEYNKSFIS